MARIKYYNPTTSSWKFADIGGEENVQSDWTQSDTTADDYIKNKPAFASVAMTGSYTDLNSRPVLATIATSGTYRDLSGKPREFDEALQNAGVDITGTIGNDIFNSSSGSNGGKRMSNENYGWVFSTTRLFHKDGLVAKYATDGFDIRPFYFYAKGFKSDDYSTYGSTWAGMYVGTGEWITNCELYTPPKTFNGQEYNYVGFNLRRSDYEELSEYDINDIKNNFSVFCLKTVEEANCPILTNTSYSNGFRAGYFGSSGNSNTSGNYARTHFPLNIPNWAEKFVVTISDDTAFKITAFSNIPDVTNGATNSSYVGEWGGISTTPNTKPIVIPFNPDYYYYISAAHSRSGLTVPTVTAYANGHCVQVDWNQSNYNAIDYIKNKPTLATVATSGSYTDLSNTPTLSSVATSGSYDDLSSVPDYTRVIDWGLEAVSVNVDYPTCWRLGYWGDDGAHKTDDNFIHTAVRFRAFADEKRYSHSLIGATKIDVELPTGLTLVVKEYSATDIFAVTDTISVSNGGSFAIKQNYMYGFSIDMGEDATDYLVDSYISQIKLTVHYKNKYLSYGTEFELFGVRTSNDWPDVSSTTNDNAEEGTMLVRRAVLALPTSYTPNGKPTPVIMLSHGSGGYVGLHGSNNGIIWNNNNSDFLAMVRAFVAGGYAVFDVNNTRDASAGFQDWGSLPLCNTYIKAWEYIKENYNVCGDLNIYSLSMGTTAALNIMKWKPFPIRCALMSAIRPVCETVYNNPNISSSAKTNMSLAFGITSGSWESDRLKGFNHAENIITINGNGYLFDDYPALKILKGQSDISNYETEIANFCDALKNSGKFVDYREVANTDHNTMCFLATGELKDEALAWFDRFNR